MELKLDLKPEMWLFKGKLGDSPKKRNMEDNHNYDNPVEKKFLLQVIESIRFLMKEYRCLDFIF